MKNDAMKNDTPIHQEVRELHRFFADWFTGRLEPTAENFARFTGVMAEKFELISPTGARTRRQDLIEQLRGAHGSHRNPSQPFRIWIENIKARALSPGLHLVTYEEWQERENRRKGRLSTALLRAAPETPHGLEWLHLHEVWLPESR